MTVLVLGAAGMLGHAVFRCLRQAGVPLRGTVRSPAVLSHFPQQDRALIDTGVDVERHDDVIRLFTAVRPAAVVNCVGVVKQRADADDPLRTIPINALLPHRLAALCELSGARLIHISTDCVFSGRAGHYREDDVADATDLYGRSKLLGEVVADARAVTLRTSIIGRELTTRHGLLEWFLGQDGPVRGFSHAVFSGLPTDELARVLLEHVLPNPDLHGLYHVAAQPISKHDLLTLVKAAYGRPTEIVNDTTVRIDRSLNPERFLRATGYAAPAWTALVDRMRAFGLPS
jgi:dTDP-4-dehydrorhamnose reductase